jgi:hypothetical protein
MSSFLLVLGCNNASRRSSPAPQDELLSSLNGLPISGCWRNDEEGFGGEFRNFVFTPAKDQQGSWQTEDGEPICMLEGSGSIWGNPDNRFEIAGRSVGRKLELELCFSDQTVKATGIVKGDDLWSSTCTIEFFYGGRPRRAVLNCASDIAAERQGFKSSTQDR